jgi:hypothetical protein
VVRALSAVNVALASLGLGAAMLFELARIGSRLCADLALG